MVQLVGSLFVHNYSGTLGPTKHAANQARSLAHKGQGVGELRPDSGLLLRNLNIKLP